MRGAGRMVTIQQRSKSGDAICKGREAVYNAITEKMVITGNAEVEHQGRRQTGNVITITRKNGDFIMEVQQSGKTAIPELKGR
jgi:lipopolysaccharide export system protein LptA